MRSFLKNKARAFRESSQRFSHGEKTKFLLDLEKDIGVVSMRRLYIYFYSFYLQLLTMNFNTHAEVKRMST
jgi:hypothetical protein